LRLRQLPPAAWVLFGGTFVNRFGTFVMPMLAMYLARSGFSVAQSGIAVGAYGAGHLATSMLGGHLADRIGRRHTIALSMFASAVTMLALSQARGYGSIVVLTFAAGLSTELYRPASSALLTDIVAADQRVLAFGSIASPSTSAAPWGRRPPDSSPSARSSTSSSATPSARSHSASSPSSRCRTACAAARRTMAEMIFAPMTGAYVTDLAPERYRGRYHGLHMLTWSIGMFVGPVLGAMMYERSETLLWSTCAASGVVAAALLLVRPAGESRAAAAETR
jgi:MFS family permease